MTDLLSNRLEEMKQRLAERVKEVEDLSGVQDAYVTFHLVFSGVDAASQQSSARDTDSRIRGCTGNDANVVFSCLLGGYLLKYSMV